MSLLRETLGYHCHTIQLSLVCWQSTNLPVCARATSLRSKQPLPCLAKRRFPVREAKTRLRIPQTSPAACFLPFGHCGQCLQPTQGSSSSAFTLAARVRHQGCVLHQSCWGLVHVGCLFSSLPTARSRVQTCCLTPHRCCVPEDSRLALPVSLQNVAAEVLCPAPAPWSTLQPLFFPYLT